MNVSDFAVALVRYCDATGASVTSWKRTGLHNRIVGGVINSQHLYGLAADVIYDEKPGLVTRQAEAAKRGLQLIVEGDHDHLQAPRMKE